MRLAATGAAVAGLLCGSGGAARADADARKEAASHLPGDHPAVVVQRLQRSTGYDCASKFYPHPAWLYLRAAPAAEAEAAGRHDGADAAHADAGGKGQAPASR